MTKLKKFFLISYNLFIIVLTIILIRNFPTSLTGHHSVYDPFIEQILNSAELDKPIRTNSYGFKDYEWNITKPNNTIRIIALGDSFTEGFGVDVNETWPKQLEAMLNNLNLSVRFEVFNMGQGGWGTYEEVEAFKIIGLQFEPDIVILQYFVNDFEPPDLKLHAKELFLQYLNGNYTPPEELQKDIETIKRLGGNEKAISMLFYQYLADSYYKRDICNKTDWNKWVEEPLRDLNNITKEKNITLVVFILPDLNSGMRPLTGFYRCTHYTIEFLSEETIPFYDFTKYFFENPGLEISDIKLPKDGHLSPYGHRIVAKKLLKFLLSNHFDIMTS